MAQPDDAAASQQQDTAQPPPDVLAHFAQQDTPQPPPDVLQHFSQPQPPPDVLAKLGPPVDRPKPGFLESVGLGLKRGATESAETFGAQPSPESEREKQVDQPWEWKDLYEPFASGAPKLGYSIARGAPGIAGGVAGGLAGTAIGGPGVGLATGAAGAGAASLIQTLGPAYNRELQKTPDDQEGAYSRALKEAEISGLGGAASWLAFPMGRELLGGPIKHIIFQAFGVQAPIAAAEQAAKNVTEGKDATDNLGQAYTSGAVGTLAPGIGHAAVEGTFRARTAVEPEAKTPEQVQALQDAKEKQAQAAQLRTQADEVEKAPPQEQVEGQEQQPQIDPEALRAQADQLDAEAKHSRFTYARSTLPLPERNKFTQGLINNAMPEMNSDKALQSDSTFATYKSGLARAKDYIVEQLRYRLWNPVSIEDRVRFIQAMEHGADFNKLSDEDIQGHQNTIAQNEHQLAQVQAAIQQHPEMAEIYGKTADLIKNDIVDAQQKLAAHDLTSKYPWMQERANTFRKWLQEGYADEAKAGSRADYLLNYFPHIWDNPIQAQQVVQRLFGNELTPQTAGQGYQKPRYYEDIQKGLDAGLKLKYDNPEDMIAARRMAGADMVQKMKLMDELYQEGVAVPVEHAPNDILQPGRDAKNPWLPVTAPNGSRWMIAPDIQPLWRNAVEAKGLWADPGTIGNLFRGWMSLKNAWIPVKLGMSLFHPVHVWHINLANNLTRSLRETFGPGQQGLARRAVAIPEAMGQSAYDTMLLLDAFFAKPIRYMTGTNFGMPHVGREIGKAWLTSPRDENARQQFLNTIMQNSGTSAQLSEQLRQASFRQVNDAIQKGEWAKTLVPSVKAAIGAATKPIFEEWIPNLKRAAVYREAEALMRRDPSIMDDPQRFRIAMRTIGKQVDNRYGEMFYGGLFWNRTLKDAAIGSFLSLGWNLGFAREFIGGALEPAARRLMDSPTPTRQLIRQTSTKSLNAFIYTMTAFATNAAIQYMLTGQSPQEWLDYVFPKIGGTNPDGSPRRMSNPFYTRELPMAEKHIEEQQSLVGGLGEMLKNKLLFQPFMDLKNNRDYFGRNIWDENAPGYQQWKQMGEYILNQQINPMSIANAQRSLELSGKPSNFGDVIKQAGDRDVWAPMLGFGPAPAYASKDEIQNRIGYLYQRYVAPQEKPYMESRQSEERSKLYTALNQALQTRDPERIHAAAMALAKAGVSTKTIKSIPTHNISQYMFQRLGETASSQQVELLKAMDAEQFKTYFRFASKKAKMDPQVVQLFRHYYQGGS